MIVIRIKEELYVNVIIYPVVKHLTVSDSNSLRDAANKVWQDNGASDQIIIDFVNSNDGC